MRNEDGLTHKEFLFCEEFLSNGGNAYQAYKKAYPSDSGNNSFQVLRRKAVIQYINKRYKQKQANLNILVDETFVKLKSLKDSKDNSISLEATKQILDYASKKEQIEIRLKEIQTNEKLLENRSQVNNEPVRITIENISKDE
jgi:hypothetical protein